MKISILIIAAALFCCGCQRTCEEFEPGICYHPTPCVFEGKPSAFPPLTEQERISDWGKQLRLAYAFAKEQDYYRAITGFKSALVFLPQRLKDRKCQIEYGIVQAYYLAEKYQEAIEYFDGSCLLACDERFPAYRDLLIMIYDCYQHTDKCEKAAGTLNLINSQFPELAVDLELSTAFMGADFATINELADCRCDEAEINDFISEYWSLAKSDQRAQLYQALLPGAGYLYVGQKDAARTSFIINLLFTWAAYKFFANGYYAAGIITASLETGWYFGGINGARLAAKEYNERVYGVNGQAFMRCHDMFPVLMLQTNF